MDATFRGEYLALMETIRTGEALAIERWGLEGAKHTAREMAMMRHLREALAALWVGFGE